MDSEKDSHKGFLEGGFQKVPRTHPFPKDPAVLKILRVVNLLLVVFLVRQADLLSRRTLCGHHFPGNYRYKFFPLKEESAP